MAGKDALSLVLSDEDLLGKYHESRKANMKLLEQRREMLLELQRTRDVRKADHNLSVKCEQLERKVEELDAKLAKMKENEDLLKKNDFDEIISPEESFTCNCACSSQLKETVKVNHQWNEAYKRAVARIHDAEKRARKFEGELKLEVEENAKLIELVNTLENDLKNRNKDRYARINSLEEVCSKEDIEVLKLQMLAFQDDFLKEKEDKDKSVKETTKLQKMLDESTKTVQSLSDQVSLYKQQITKLSRNQDHLCRQIRALANEDGIYQYQPMHRQLSYRHSFPQDSQDTNSANATTRSSDTDMFFGGRVVRDALCDS